MAAMGRLLSLAGYGFGISKNSQQFGNRGRAGPYAEALLRLAFTGPPLPFPFDVSMFTRPLQSG